MLNLLVGTEYKLKISEYYMILVYIVISTYLRIRLKYFGRFKSNAKGFVLILN